MYLSTESFHLSDLQMVDNGIHAQTPEAIQAVLLSVKISEPLYITPAPRGEGWGIIISLDFSMCFKLVQFILVLLRESHGTLP